MSNIFQYAKTIAALIGAILTSVAASLPQVPLWLTIALAVATAVAVFVVPNAVTEDQKAEIQEDPTIVGINAGFTTSTSGFKSTADL